MLKSSMHPERLPLLRHLGAQFTKFALAGGAGTALHYLLLIVLVSAFDVQAAHAAFVGAVAGAFDSQRAHAQTLPRFAFMATIGALLNSMLVGTLSASGTHFLLAQMIATIVILVINFIVSKLWIFR
jgi:putative flippase GtrA